MKKSIVFIALFLLLSLIISAFNAVAIEDAESPQLIEEPVFWYTGILDAFGGAKLSVTDITDVADLQKGERLDVYYRLKSNIAGSKYRVEPCFVWTTKTGTGTTCMPILTSNIAHEVGDTYKIRVTNLDTSKIPDAACNNFVKLAGTHEVWTTTADIGSDGKPTGATTSKWVVDSEQTARKVEQDNSNFFLKCGTETCKAHDTGVIKCDEAYVKGRSTVVIGYVKENCYEGFKYKVCDVGLKCEQSSGNCVTDANAEKLKNGYPCFLNDALCDSGMCVAGLCSSKLLSGGDLCIDNSDCENNKCVNDKCAVEVSGGLEDSDGDRIADSVDKCPEERGNAPSGCIENNGDGGIIVSEDECSEGSVKIGECEGTELQYPIECEEGKWVVPTGACLGTCEGDACKIASKICENPDRACGGVCEECTFWDKFVTWLKKFIGGEAV